MKKITIIFDERFIPRLPMEAVEKLKRAGRFLNKKKYIRRNKKRELKDIIEKGE